MSRTSQLSPAVLAAGALALAASSGAQARTDQETYNAAFAACEAAIAADVGVTASDLRFDLTHVRSRPRYVRVAFDVRLGQDDASGVVAECTWRPTRGCA